MPCTFRPTMVAGAQRDRILFAFIFLLLCLSDLCCALENNTVKVGVILDLDSWIGRVSKTAIELAVEDMNNDTQLLKGKRLVVDIRDSRNDALYGASAAVDLMKEEMVAIIGPQTSEVAEFVSHLGNAANVPIVSFSVTSSLLSKNRFPYFVPMAHSDAISMKAIAAVVKSYGWRRIVVIYPDNDIDYGGVDSLSDELRDVGSEVEYRAAISATMNRDAMREELYRLNNMQSRIFVVHLNASLGLSLLEEAYAIGMMGVNYVWMTTEAFTDLWNVMLDDSTMAFMQGLLGVKTYRPISYNLDKFNKRWIQKFRAENPHERRIELSEYGVLAYDAVESIARAIGKLESFHFLKPVWKPSSHPTIAGNSMDVTKIKIFHEGHTLLQEIHNLNFTGLSGPVEVSDKRFLNSVYQILNLVGKSYHVVGYWSNKYKMISRELSSADTWSDQMMVLPKNTSGKLGAVIWPGGSIGVPRGWAIPTIAKRLQIGVPLHKGFREFLSVQNDSSNHSTVSGFSIDVFDAVVRRLDYPLPYDLIPYKIDTFDDFIYQVYLNKFDAAVGDTTILENRSKYVDFSQPFSESGLVMVVPIKKNEANNAWAFLLPFTPGMWCATGGFFIFTGVVVWLLEHKINPRFRGKPSAQLVTLLWFSFSTLFFSHRERIVNSLSRIVVIVWLFVVLILTSSYTASLTSMLTVQQIKPSIASVEFVKARGLPVGYRAGSFVHNYLLDHFRIPEENLKPYSTKKEYAEALSKGPNKGGVAAIIDEIPYMRVFLSKHCGYMMVEPTYRTGGLGFVFPKGSPLLSDISRAVLSLVEDDEMKNIEAKYFDSNLCSTPGPIVGSNRLSMESFWGLYLVTGTVSALALMVFFFRLACNFTRESNDTTEERIECKSVKSFAKYLDRKDSNRQRLAEANSSACSTPYAPQAITFSRDTSSLDSEENLP